MFKKRPAFQGAFFTLCKSVMLAGYDPKPISGPVATVENQLSLSARAARAYDPGV